MNDKAELISAKIMVTNTQDNKLLFIKCKQSVLEIVGWKSFIFLPHNFVWRFFIIFTVILSTILNITCCFHRINKNFADIIRLLCDIGYFVDVVLATLHYAMSRTRSLRHEKKRFIVLLIFDYISLLPFTIIFGHLNYKTNKENINLSCYFHLSEFLRIYQVPKSFCDMKHFIYKVRTYVIVTFFEVLSYLVLLTYVLSCLIVLRFDEDQKKFCEDNVFRCISNNYFITFCIFGQLFISPFQKYSVQGQKALLVTYYIVGYLFTYAYIFPLVLFLSFKYLVKVLKSSIERIHLKVLLKNIIEDKKLKDKILNQIHYTRIYGKGDQRPEILNIVPLCLRKNIFCDMHWEAIRHSEFFQDLSIGCKRSLALFMTTEFLVPGTTLFKKTEKNTYFIYIESGLLQIMSVDNSESPVINLSSGTVLGEISFFFQVESKATLRVAQLSAVHLLHFRDFFRVLTDYPKDLRKIFHKLKTRLKLARSIHINKTQISPQFSFEDESSKFSILLKQGDLKWLKEQYRAVCELEKAEKLRETNFNRESMYNYQRQLQKLKTQLEHTSIHLPHININDININKFEVVCMKLSFPWIMNPQCHFFRVWNTVVFFLVIFTVLLYPTVTGWIPRLPQWFFNISIVVSLINITDVLLQLITSVKAKNVVISKFGKIFAYRLNSPAFWTDVLAALPFQLFISNHERNKDFGWNIYFLNVLLKTYKLISKMSKWTYSAQPGAFVRVCVKYLFFFIIFLIWSAATFNFAVDDWEIYSDSEWYTTLEKQADLPLSIVASVVKALFTVLKIPGSNVEKEVLKLFFFSSFFSNFFHFFFITMISECIAAYVMESAYELEYKKLMKFIYDFMGENNLVGRLRSRVIDMMKFQLDYEKGNNIAQRNQITKYVSMDLKKEIIQKSLLQILAKSKLFESEAETFQLDLCKKAVPLVVPKNSVLLTFGIKPMGLFVIKKGYIQMNSFISEDIHMNISTPMIAKEGDVFPVIDAFSQSPAAVTAIAITDCQLIQLDLEDVLSTMIVHGVLKDLVEAVKATNLSPLSSAKLGISTIKEDFRFDKKHHEVVFKRYKYLKYPLKFFLRKKAIDSQSDWYARWELSRFVLILFGLFSWPVVFGFSAKSHNLLVIVSILFINDCVSWIDFYFRLHAPYYNKIGICVTHTLYTSLHYLSTSFVVDLIAFAPNFHLLWCFFKKTYDFDLNIVIIHLLMRSVSFYRIIGFFRYLNQRNVFYNLKLVQVFFFITVGVHYYVNLQLYIYFKKTENLSNEDKNLNFTTFLKYYFTEVGLVFSMILKNIHHFEDFKLIDLVLSIIFAVLGYFLRIYIYGNITLLSIASDKNLNFYQYYMKSFIEYLNCEKADESLLNVVADYFKNDLEVQKGYDLHEIFSRFPQTLHEDIMYSMYKKTFNGVECLSKANEAFYRILSRNVEEIYSQKGSMIIYKNQVQGNIFFIHKGQCFVENLSTVLYKGSIMGDFQPSKIMKNTITAKTNVQLLKISSKAFFLAINNFHYTKMAFQSEAAKAENFIASVYFEQEKRHSLETFLIENSDEKSEFISTNIKQDFTKNYSLKKKRLILNPESLMAYVLDNLSLFVVYVTLFLIPAFIVFRIFSPVFLGIIYFLDAAWIIKIILITRTAFYDEKTGYYVYDVKAIRRRYMRLKDGFITHFLSVLPIEVLPFIYFGLKASDKCCSIMSYFYINRLLRGTFLLTSKKEDRTKLLTNFFKELIKVLLTKLIFINFCVSFHMILKDYEENMFRKCYWDFHYSHIEAIITSYFWVLNINVDEHHGSHQSDQYIQSFFRLFLSICSFLSKVFLLNEVLMIMFVKFQIKSDEMLKLEHLENYLLVRDVSPILFKRSKKYFCYLLNSFNESAEPLFLRTSPPFIKAKIMQEFYTHHFLKCYPFQDVEITFVKQLAERLERYIFFPGDYITEKGDVDHNMYFIHRGEVYCIEKDKNIKDLEEPVNVFVTGQNFGVLQGILAAYPHTNTYRAKTLSDVLVLNYSKWKDLRVAFPDIAELIFKKCLEYKSISKDSVNMRGDLTKKSKA